MITTFYKSSDKAFTVLKGDCVDLVNQIDFEFDMIFADPPYFLSNDGVSIQSGQKVSVNKGEWDRSRGYEKDNEFNYSWLKACREHLTDNGTIWISGTFHNIFSVAHMLNELDYKILNCITWAKTNPPPNFSCRCFTHSTEFIIWAKKSNDVTHHYNYDLMKKINGGTQMKDIWNMPAVSTWEKTCGKHPTQKPLSLLTRIILASTKKNAWILDPFTGSSTTGIAANLLNRKFLGIDKEEVFLNISEKRKIEIENPEIFETYKTKLCGCSEYTKLDSFLVKETETEYQRSLKL